MATPASVSFHTLGCKLNFSETSTIRRQFEQRGYAIRSFGEGSDITVINTCSVTDFADRKCRKAIRAALRYSPDSKVIVVGCYAQLKPEEISNIEGVDLVLGAGEKFRILDYLDQLEKVPEKGWVAADDVREVDGFESAFSFGDRTRSFLKVQDGCDYNCSFCTIPQARGQSRSTDISQVLTNVRQLAKQGTQEIVLTGINLGDFGIIDGKRRHSFLDLLRALERVNDVARYRISSIEPNLCTDDIVEFVAAAERIMPHFHMPLQSGTDKQLRQMRRRYSRQLYKKRTNQIKSLIPHACIGVDVIVGFPGETDQDFAETKNFLRSLPISYLHVFTYSERANTLAASMSNQIPMSVRRSRNEQLRALSHEKKSEFLQAYLGSDRQVLLENSKKSGVLSGYTDNYIKVEVKEEGFEINDLVQVSLIHEKSDHIVAGAVRSGILL